MHPVYQLLSKLSDSDYPLKSLHILKNHPDWVPSLLQEPENIKFIFDYLALIKQLDDLCQSKNHQKFKQQLPKILIACLISLLVLTLAFPLKIAFVGFLFLQLLYWSAVIFLLKNVRAFIQAYPFSLQIGLIGSFLIFTLATPLIPFFIAGYCIAQYYYFISLVHHLYAQRAAHLSNLFWEKAFSLECTLDRLALMTQQLNQVLETRLVSYAIFDQLIQHTNDPQDTVALKNPMAPIKAVGTLSAQSVSHLKWGFFPIQSKKIIPSAPSLEPGASYDRSLCTLHV